jgi:hypothetical protein
MGDRYVKLPYTARLRLKASKKLRRAASRAEAGLWRENGVLTTAEKEVVYAAAAVIRDAADQARRDALCR